MRFFFQQKYSYFNKLNSFEAHRMCKQNVEYGLYQIGNKYIIQSLDYCFFVSNVYIVLKLL